jgi:hypothetical protein
MRDIFKILLLVLIGHLAPAECLAIGEDVCDCVKIKVHAQDTISKNTYLNYKFTVKNTCSVGVWINTGFFGFTIYNADGKPAQQLKKLTFVKRYNYPEFVQIAPAAEYEFKFSDDAFFEFKMDRRNKYIVGLKYSNTKAKHAVGKNMNYLCTRELKRTIYVK